MWFHRLVECYWCFGRVYCIHLQGCRIRQASSMQSEPNMKTFILWRICSRHHWATDRWAGSSACTTQQYCGRVSFVSAHARVMECSTVHVQVMSDNGTRQPSGCATVGDRFLRWVCISCCATVEMSQAVFSASPLGGYISRLTEAVQSV
jgi:hypothetical protein